MPFTKGQNRVYIFKGQRTGIGVGVSGRTTEETEEIDGWDLIVPGSEGNVNVAFQAHLVQTSTSSSGAGNFEARVEEAIPLTAIDLGDVSTTSSFDRDDLYWNTAKSVDNRNVIVNQSNRSFHLQIIRGAKYRISCKSLAAAEHLEVRIACN